MRRWRAATFLDFVGYSALEPLRFDLKVADAVGPRLGTLHTPHGPIATPAFMPVGTLATVKSLDPEDLRALGPDCVLANAYHLSLRPGADLVARLGGLHRFMGWNGPMLTDSGGFQVFSLGHLRKVTDDGVWFRSPYDGSEQFYSPERVVAIQEALGADLIMVLDECSPYPAERERVVAAARRTRDWAARCRACQRRPDQWLFGIVQGGLYPELRRDHARALVDLDFPGYAVGGLSVGEPKEQMYDVLALTTAELPVAKPRYLMGVGSPEDLIEGVARGVDLFDCVLPTRIARNGALLTARGRLNLRNARFREQSAPVDPDCECSTCRRFSAAYLHHLFRNDELLAYRLATIHNLHFLLDLMRRVRAAIASGAFARLRADFLANWVAPDAEARAEGRRRWEARVAVPAVVEEA